MPREVFPSRLGREQVVFPDRGLVRLRAAMVPPSLFCCEPKKKQQRDSHNRFLVGRECCYKDILG